MEKSISLSWHLDGYLHQQKPVLFRGKQNELVVLSDAEHELLSMQEQAKNQYSFL
jgi:hypothetical protein